jgi:hypothetical protein
MGIHQRQKMHWMAYLWPGFPHLWNRGSWAGLALAVGFTVLLNVLLVATLVWTGWMSHEARQIGFGVLVVIWALAWLESRADWQRFLAERRVLERENVGTGSYGIDEEGATGVSATEVRATEVRATGEQESEEMSDRIYRDAQRNYLAGDWVRCEQRLRQLLQLDKRDVESQLMLATLWRHLGRTEEAVRQLHELECLEAAAPWSYEISHELDQLAYEPVELDRRVDPHQLDLDEVDCPISPTNNNESSKNETTISVTIEGHPAQSEQQQADDQSFRAA